MQLCIKKKHLFRSLSGIGKVTDCYKTYNTLTGKDGSVLGCKLNTLDMVVDDGHK